MIGVVQISREILERLIPKITFEIVIKNSSKTLQTVKYTSLFDDSYLFFKRYGIILCSRVIKLE